MGGDYGKKDLENADSNAPRGIRVSLWEFFIFWFRNPVIHSSSQKEMGLGHVRFDQEKGG